MFKSVTPINEFHIVPFETLSVFQCDYQIKGVMINHIKSRYLSHLSYQTSHNNNHF